MITLPISALTLIILIVIAVPLLCALVVILTHRVDSKLERERLDKRRADLTTGELNLANNVESIEGREWVVAERERMQQEHAEQENLVLQKQRSELHQRASDLDALVKAQMHLMDDHDTTIMDIFQETQ